VVAGDEAADLGVVSYRVEVGAGWRHVEARELAQIFSYEIEVGGFLLVVEFVAQW